MYEGNEMTTERFTLSSATDRAYAWLRAAQGWMVHIDAGRVVVVRR